MGSPYQSEEVCCFNAGNWNLVRCACYMICTLQERKKKQALHSSSRLCFPPSTADLIHGIKTELSEFCMNKSFTSVSLHVTLFLFFFLCVVHLCRSLRRGRCCKLRKKAADLLPLPRNWDEQPESGGGYAPTVSVNPDHFNYDTHTKCLYCNFCHELIPCT